MNRKILLEASKIEKNYGECVLLHIDRLTVYEGQKVGLIGENGAGKSTLLRILAGEMIPDAGTIRRFGDHEVIHQTGGTVKEISPGMRSRFQTRDDGVGLSGGEQTRRRIAAAFSRNVPLLFADEPTTDLDRDGITLLENHLKELSGALVLVSHDRRLLDTICDTVWYLEDGKVSVFSGSYSAFREEMKRRRHHQQEEYEQYRGEKARLEASMRDMQERIRQVRKAPGRMGNSEARLHTRAWTDTAIRLSRGKSAMQSRLNQLEVKERPRDLPAITMTFGTSSSVAAKNALTAESVSLTVGDRLLLGKSNFTVPTGSRTAILGPNGCGKTTLLRMLCLGDAAPEGVRYGGRVKLNSAVKIGWFDQDHSATLNPEKTALDNVMRTAVTDESTVRTAFARVNMAGDAVFKPVSVLSGGERAKTALVRLLVSECNLLVLDEPTNHLDIFTMEALEELMKEYGGTMLLVSHDRAFVSAVATRLLCFENGSVRTFEGTLREMEREMKTDYDREKKALEISTLQMRMAALAGRMSAPRKGEDPLKLNEEYQALAEAIRRLKQEEG